MKKIIICFILLTSILIKSDIYAQDSYQIYVSDIDTNKQVYNVGDKVEGVFKLSNLATTSQSDIYYTVSSGKYDESILSIVDEYGITTKMGPKYIQAQSEEKINFTYNLPEYLTGYIGIRVTATLKDGTLVGRADLPIDIEGKVTKEVSKVIASNFEIPGINDLIGSKTGPTIYKGDTLSFQYLLSSTTKEYTVSPVLNIYDRVDNPDALKKTINLDPIKVGSGKNEYKIKLPIDLTPGVYYGVLSFKSTGLEVSSVDLRYIISGPMATVRNINSEILEVKKDQVFDINVTYGSQPTDEYRPERQQRSVASTTITVKAFNENKEEIASVTQPIVLDEESRNLKLSITASKDAKSISYVSTIQTPDGKILDEFKTTLPSKEELKNQSPITLSFNDIKGNMLWYILIGLLLVLVSVVLIIRKKKKLSSNLLMLLLLVSVSFIGITIKADVTDDMQEYLDGLGLGANDLTMGWKVVQAYRTVDDTTNSGYSDYQNFQITSIMSPYPPIMKTYEPGEKFTLNFNAVYGDCNNEGRHYYAFAYKSDTIWKNQTPVTGPATKEGLEARLAYWSNSDKVSKLLNWNNGDTWKELFLKSDLKVITRENTSTSQGEISSTKESVLNSIVSITDIDWSGGGCSWAGIVGLSGTDCDIRARVYRGNDSNPDNDDTEEYVVWIRNNYNKIQTIKNKLATMTNVLDDTPGLKNFDFTKIGDLKIGGNTFTNTYITRLKALDTQVDDYSDKVLWEFAGWYSGGSHATEITPVSLSRTYTAPTEPGMHKLFFYLYQDGNSHPRDMTIRQIICVRGANKCPKEQTIPKISITVSNIATTTAKLNWTYKDENPQVKYRAKVSKGQLFNSSAVIKTFNSDGLSAGAIETARSLNMTGLEGNTYYTVQFEAKNSYEWSTSTTKTFKTTGTSPVVATTYSCQGRSLVGKQGTTVVSTEQNSPSCTLSAQCTAVYEGTETVFRITPIHGLGNITYVSSGQTTETLSSSTVKVYRKPKTTTTQSISSNMTDAYDGNTYTSSCSISPEPTTTTCACNGTSYVCTGAEPSTTLNSSQCQAVNGTTCACDGTSYVCTGTSPSTTLDAPQCNGTNPPLDPPVIDIRKTPSISLNKGGTCTISWNIQNMPQDTTCSLIKNNIDPVYDPITSLPTGSYSPQLQQNTKFTVKCVGPNVDLSDSVICRVNTEVLEN